MSTRPGEQEATTACDCDVVIIGGGPAGSTAATLLKKYAPHRRVVIVERARFPRHHIGESTLPEANRILAKMGVLEKIDAAGFVRKRGVTYRWARDKPFFSDVFSAGVLDALAGTEGYIPDHSWQVDRSRYDAILLEHARACGVEVLEETRVVGVVRRDDRIAGVEVMRRDERATLSSQFVVDCSGQARVLSTWLGLAKQAHALGDLAIYRYYRGFRWNPELIGSLAASRIFFQASRGGWMWFIPLSESLVSVGLVTRREFLKDTEPALLFESELADLKDIRDMLPPEARLAAAPADADPTPRTHVIADWSYSHDVPAGPGYYLAGDAAAFVDPILSSGVLLAHQSGMTVANAIHTEWSCPDIGAEELHSAYAELYRDLYGGFLRMARWWYTRRDVGIDEWLRLARQLGDDALGAKQISIDDSSSFMTFAAGFLTDFRFVNVGCGFGDKGLGETIDGIESTDAGRRLLLELPDRSVRLRRNFDRIDVAPYLVTHVDTDRWWRVPLLRFWGPAGEQSYRPVIPPEQHSDEWVRICVHAIERLLRACDGTATIEHVVARTRDSFPRGRDRAIQRFCDSVLAALSVKGLLVPA